MKLRVAVFTAAAAANTRCPSVRRSAIMQGMDPAKYEIIEYFIDKEGRWNPRPILPEPGAQPEIDVVFPVLHGTFGEDGTVQGLLELADLPYVGAGVLASSVSMDKEMMKRVCRERMLPVVDYVTVTRESPDITGGLRARCRSRCSSSPPIWARRWGFRRRTMRTSWRPPGAGGAIRPQDHRGARHRRPRAGMRGAGQRGARGFPALRDPALARILRLRGQVPAGPGANEVPADLPPEKTEELRRLAVECYRAVECEGMARVDFLLEAATGKFYINEINTIPGFTSISMYPKMWEHSGIPFSALIDRLIELALDRHQRKKATRFAR